MSALDRPRQPLPPTRRRATGPDASCGQAVATTPQAVALRAARAVVAASDVRGGRLQRGRDGPESWTFNLRPDAASARPRYALRVLRVAGAGTSAPPGSRSCGALLRELRSEVDWLAALAADGRVPAPVPVGSPGDPFPAGAAYVLDGAALGDPGAAYTVLVTDWVGWRRVWRPEARGAAARVGAAVAALHDCAARFRPGPRFTRPRWDGTRLLGYTPGREFHAADLLAAHGGVGRDDLALVRAAEARVWAALGGGSLGGATGDGSAGATPTHGDAIGLIHGRLDPDHVAVLRGLPPEAGACAAARGATHIGVVDFAACGWGAYLADVAGVLRTLDETEPDNGAGPHTLKATFLASYDAARPLPATFARDLALYADAWDLRELGVVLRAVGPPDGWASWARVRALVARVKDRAT